MNCFSDFTLHIGMHFTVTELARTDNVAPDNRGGQRENCLAGQQSTATGLAHLTQNSVSVHKVPARNGCMVLRDNIRRIQRRRGLTKFGDRKLQFSYRQLQITGSKINIKRIKEIHAELSYCTFGRYIRTVPANMHAKFEVRQSDKDAFKLLFRNNSKRHTIQLYLELSVFLQS